jgi:hypothetical protein
MAVIWKQNSYFRLNININSISKYRYVRFQQFDRSGVPPVMDVLFQRLHGVLIKQQEEALCREKEVESRDCDFSESVPVSGIKAKV